MHGKSCSTETQFSMSLINLPSSERKSANFLPDERFLFKSLVFINKMQGDNHNSPEFGGEWEMLSYPHVTMFVSSDQEQGCSCSRSVQEGRAERRQKSNANLMCLID